MTNTGLDSTMIYEQYGEKILRYILGKVNDRYLAEDLRSEVFLKIDEKLATYNVQKAALSTWVFTIARNTLIDYFRTRRVHEQIPETLAAKSSDVEEKVCNDESLESLAYALEKLEKRERDIIVLRYYSGLTLKEIGQKMNISYAYVKLLHNKALQLMKKYFEK